VGTSPAEDKSDNAAQLARANEELQREIGYRRRAEEQHAKFAAIIESSNDAIIAHHLDGTIVTWNKGAERLFGYSADEAQGRSISMLVPPDVDDELPRTAQAIRRGEPVQQLELIRIRKDGTRIAVSLTVSPIKDTVGRIVGVSRIARDVTQQKQTEQALRESEAKARAILDTAVDGIITIDHRGIIKSFNRASERLFGYRAGEVIGKNVNMLMPEPYRGEHDGYLRNYLQTGIAKIIGIGREVVAQRKDGGTFPIDLSVSEVQLGDPLLFSGIIHDLSERRMLEKEILEISEKEKRRMGQDLHDGLGQLLTGIGFKSKFLENKLAKQGLPEAESARQLAELVTQAIAESRAISRGLQPVSLEVTGLMSALQELAANLQQIFKIGCTFVCPEQILVADGGTSMHLYRIAQEAANNAIKHGKATSVTITLERRDSNLRLAVIDDGVGFVPGISSGGMGLHIMRYRAAMIGATLLIESRPEGGTAVSCVISRS
jgi:two-component system, LuxR family, sensor kinase FixL